MSRFALAYVGAAIVFVVADFFWLGYVAKDLYRSQMAHLLAPDFRMGPAAIFYLMFLAGIIYFAVTPALATGRWQDAIIPGAILGFLAYGTYDFTNWAVMRDWPVGLTFIDLAWGTALTSAAATAGAALAIRFS
jgi:uncharacterized membrane protein